MLVAVFFEALDFLGLFAFFVVAFLVVFFSGLAALLVVVLAAATVDDAPVVVVLVEGLAAFFGFDAAAVFFFGDAAFFVELFAFASPVAFGLADSLDFVLVVLAFLVTVALFFVALATEVLAGPVADAAVATVLVVDALVLAVATFFVPAFLVGEGERLRLAPPVVDFDLLDERAFVVPLGFLLPVGVFDRLRGVGEVDFVEVRLFRLVEVVVFFTIVANLKLPLAPTPLVCLIV